MKKLIIASLSLILSASALATVPVTAAPPGAGVEPPEASFGVKFCHEIVIWVVLQNGKVIRVDKAHHPKTPEDMQKFLAWLETGPSDIAVLPCPVET